MKESTLLQLKNINRRMVLHYMRSNANVTKAGMASVTGLTFMAIKKMIAELEQLSLIRNDRYEEGSGAGRKALSYTINESFGYVVGVHINRFITRAAVMDLKGHLIVEAYRNMEQKFDDQNVLMELLFELIEETIHAAGIDTKKLIGIGIGVPGPVDAKKGIVLAPPNFPALLYLPLADIIKEKFHFPVFLQKDTNAIALGEYWNGAGKGASSIVYIDLDIGIGSGIILNGKIYSGFNQTAGELGHMTVDKEGPTCSCGNKGCLEVVSSCAAIVSWFVQKLNEQPEHDFYKKRAAITILDILKAAGRNDVLAVSSLNNAAYYIGTAISNLVSFFDPQRIILGGLLISEHERFAEVIRSIAVQRKMKGTKDSEIVTSALKERAGVIGAGELVIDYFFDEIVNRVLTLNSCTKS